MRKKISHGYFLPIAETILPTILIIIIIAMELPAEFYSVGIWEFVEGDANISDKLWASLLFDFFIVSPFRRIS